MWRKFEKQLEEVQRNVQETDYMVELLTLRGSVDLERLQTAADRLKVRYSHQELFVKTCEFLNFHYRIILIDARENLKVLSLLTELFKLAIFCFVS